jgi:alpha-glucosidase
VAEKGLFIRDSETDAPERSSFWDDEGSHLDFTNPQTVAWWQDGVTRQLLEMGIDSPGMIITNLKSGMAKPAVTALARHRHQAYSPGDAAADDARLNGSPAAFRATKRPYLISRSGCAGMQRYVQTWSGDNRTSWETLRYNTRMGLGMSLSGLYNVGHDVGGFSGDKPDAELFVRWVQNGVMHPRFTIHSWNDDQTVNEAWMYPGVTPAIRSAIELRYRLLPYLYTLLWQAHADDEPMLRPTFLDHEHDPQTFEECDDFLLGRDLLVASVVEPDQRQRRVWLPENCSGWYDFYSGSGSPAASG